MPPDPPDINAVIGVSDSLHVYVSYGWGGGGGVLPHPLLFS